MQILSKLYKNWIRKNENRAEKFLLKKAYEYFYEVQGTAVLGEVDFPMFIYEHTRKITALKLAKEAVAEVVSRNSAQELYKRYKKLEAENERR